MTELLFHRPELTRSSKIDSSSIEALEQAVNYLRDPRVLGRAATGFLTLGMIKPSLHDAFIDPTINDIDAATLVESEIVDLDVVARASITFDMEAVDEFYDGPPKYDSMLPSAPIRDQRFNNRWEEYADMMTSGPSTILLLGEEEGSAVAKWRAQLGHWNIEAKRDPNTIRGRYARDNHNNLLHGSDSPESVLREMRIVSNLFERALFNVRAEAQ